MSFTWLAKHFNKHSHHAEQIRHLLREETTEQQMLLGLRKRAAEAQFGVLWRRRKETPGWDRGRRELWGRRGCGGRALCRECSTCGMQGRVTPSPFEQPPDPLISLSNNSLFQLDPTLPRIEQCHKDIWDLKKFEIDLKFLGEFEVLMVGGALN